MEHLDGEHLDALSKGAGGPVTCRAVLHLLGGCRQCREEVARRYSTPVAADEGVYHLALPDAARALKMRVQAEEAAASGAIDSLTPMRFDQQVVFLRTQKDLHTPRVTDHLGERSHRLIGDDPARAQQLAELSVMVADLLDEGWYGKGLANDFRGRARRRLGNVLRRRSDLAASEAALAEARQFLRCGSSDPLEFGELDAIEALLRKDQTRFEEALRASARALRAFDRFSSQHRAGRALADRAAILRAAGQIEAAIRTLFRATARLDPETEPRVGLKVLHNMAVYHNAADRPEQALRFLQAAKPLYDRLGTRAEQLRRYWLEGSIQLTCGALDAALGSLTIVRNGFADLGMALEVAVASLEIGLIYARQGRSGDLKRLATEMEPIFSARGLDREALAALTLFRRAVDDEAVTSAIVERALGSVVVKVDGMTGWAATSGVRPPT